MHYITPLNAVGVSVAISNEFIQILRACVIYMGADNMFIVNMLYQILLIMGIKIIETKRKELINQFYLQIRHSEELFEEMIASSLYYIKITLLQPENL